MVVGTCICMVHWLPNLALADQDTVGASLGHCRAYEPGPSHCSARARGGGRIICVALAVKLAYHTCWILRVWGKGTFV